MSQPAHRRCPACGVAFLANEAVLQCSGCRALHHPACWVERDGCATPGAHEGQPLPLAFRGGPPPAPAPSPRPAPPPARPAAMRAPPRMEGVRAPARRPSDIGVLGRAPRSRGWLLRYWYVPAGLLLAAAIALGIVWGVEQFGGGGDSAPAAATPTATPATTLVPTPAATPTPVSTPTATPTPPPPRFAAGAGAIVAGTDSCLNIRASARIDAAVIDCVADGVEVTVLEGPVAASGFNWWLVTAPEGNGWAAGIYLEKP